MDKADDKNCKYSKKIIVGLDFSYKNETKWDISWVITKGLGTLESPELYLL